MQTIIVPDNFEPKDKNGKIRFTKEEQEQIKLCSEQIKKINTQVEAALNNENSNILIYPPQKHESLKDKKKFIDINKEEGVIKTYNLIGFVALGDCQLLITSRFDKDEKQYFFQYLLSKVFQINLVNLQTPLSRENIFYFLSILLFPAYLRQALKQGIYKQYVYRNYNDDRPKGFIDFSRHIKENFPFIQPRVTYRVREYSADNLVTQLIRHTIEHIKTTQFASVLKANSQYRDDAQAITFVTQSYNKNHRQKIITQNLRPATHPFYTEYEPLRRLCINILTYKGLSYNKSQNRAYGILFDAAWLWEEYLYTLLKPWDFEHPENKKQQNSITFCGKDFYPDFYIKKKMVLDAKYKHVNKNISHDDISQVLAYMKILSADKGGLVYPSEEDSNKNQCNNNNHCCEFYKIPVHIPQNTEVYLDFAKQMEESEGNFGEIIKSLL